MHSTNNADLGRLISVHPIAPIYVQRAVFIALLSFLFFAAMMVAFYVRQSLGYFLLATGFLFVYLVTMFSWFSMRKKVVQVFENGFEYRNVRYSWSDVTGISEKPPLKIDLAEGRPLELPSTIAEPDILARRIKRQISGAS
jgi:hypothetical protein